MGTITSRDGTQINWRRRPPRSAVQAMVGLVVVCFLAGCASMMEQPDASSQRPDSSGMIFRNTVWATILARIEERKRQAATKADTPSVRQGGDPGEVVLAAGHRLALVEKKVIRGSCWDFVNAVYDAAGFSAANRSTVFQSKQDGPYADPGTIRPGDWVMHRNLEFGQIEHSSIFVEWKDRDRHIARTLDYAGMDKNVTGGYSEHRYSKVFAVVRPEKQE